MLLVEELRSCYYYTITSQVSVDAIFFYMVATFTAVFFEQGEYDKTIQECNEAVDIGRENRADFQLIAKSVNLSFKHDSL